MDENLNHIVFSRMSFKDKFLLKKYLNITKDVLIPCLESQTNKNFKWGIQLLKEDFDFVRNFLCLDFIPFFNRSEYIDYVKLNKPQIQTRDDIDDYMSSNYIEKIQEIYKEKIKKYDTFLIQAQPTMVNYKTNEEYRMSKYSNIRNSMFLSLCQKETKYDIHHKNHKLMNKIVSKVITLEEGYVKWVIHGDNISCKREKILFKIKNLI